MCVFACSACAQLCIINFAGKLLCRHFMLIEKGNSCNNFNFSITVRVILIWKLEESWNCDYVYWRSRNLMRYTSDCSRYVSVSFRNFFWQSETLKCPMKTNKHRIKTFDQHFVHLTLPEFRRTTIGSVSKHKTLAGIWDFRKYWCVKINVKYQPDYPLFLSMLSIWCCSSLER